MELEYPLSSPHQEHFRGRSPSGLGKPGTGEEVFSQELWRAINKEISSKGNQKEMEASDTSVFSLKSCPLYHLIPYAAQEFWLFLHNPNPRPKQSWEQLDSPWWLISSWRGNPVGRNPIQINSNLQLHFYVNFLKGCSSLFHKRALVGASTEIWFLVVSPACSLLMQPGIHSGDPCVCQSSFLHLCSSLTGDPVCAHQRHYLASLLGLGQLLNFGDTHFGWALPGNKNILFLWCHLPGSAAQQQLLLGAPCRVVPATCPLLPAWGRAVLPAGRHQQGRCSPCSLQAVTAPVAQGGAHTCPVCASRARDIATLPLRRMGQESWTLFSPSPTHCHAGERGVICAGHGANMDCDNLHFCYFLFPGKRGKVKPVLAIVGCILPYSKAMV